VYYRSTDRPVVDQGTLGLFFNQGKATALSSDLTLDATAVAPDKLRASARLTRDMRVWALQPDLAADISSIEVSARTADGGTQILLLMKNPAMAWPTPYILKTPRLLRRGTELSFVIQKRTAAPPLRLRISRY
jgi:hypothetical protein